MDDEKPSTKHLVLKPREVVPIDRLSRPGDGTAISVQLIHEQNRLAEEKVSNRKREGTAFPVPSAEPGIPQGFKAREIDPVNMPARPGDEEAIHVPEMLLQNRIAEERSSWGRVKRWKKRKTRRNLDFLIGVGSIDLAIMAVMLFTHNEVSLIFGISGITLVTSVAAWVMYVVMDEY
jgi:hypothetical protein